MASLGRVQSPRMRTTLGLSRRALTASLSSTSFLFTWQVMHHSAVTSTKTTRSEEHTSELQSLMRISYAVFCLKKNKISKRGKTHTLNITDNVTHVCNDCHN